MKSHAANSTSQMSQGFIIAGGRSRRMGRDKAFIELDGTTFLDRARAALADVCESVSLVLSEEQEFGSDLPVVRDVFPGRGALGGLHAALVNCGAKIAIVLAVDLPQVTPEAAANLLAVAEASPKYLAVVPRDADRRPQPLFAAYRARFCIGPLEELMRSDPRASVKDLLGLINPRYIDQSRLSDDPDLLLNVNTADDLKLLKGDSGS
jgi:molybdopterin-guanine dinucleotide biosynthesis protein A